MKLDSHAMGVRLEGGQCVYLVWDRSVGQGVPESW